MFLRRSECRPVFNLTSLAAGKRFLRMPEVGRGIAGIVPRPPRISMSFTAGCAWVKVPQFFR
jgi:hypothetical protein